MAAFGDGVAYAAKAFLCLAMAQLAHEEGMHIDVATGGELHVALAAGVPADRLVLHGNNKSLAELRTARAAGVGRIVVDSFDELERLAALHTEDGRRPTVLIRATPGVEAHTHEFVRTGPARLQVRLRGALRRRRPGRGAGPGLAGSRAGRAPHAHRQPGVRRRLLPPGRRGGRPLRAATWVCPSCRSAAGSGVAYVEGEDAPSITEWGTAIVSACRDAGLDARVSAEPGRSIVAQAAVTLYTVGTIKDVPDVRTYVSVDGGMSDNPRPVLYGSGYEAFLPARRRTPSGPAA